MSNNKIRKYLFYALGETVLVVLGILIALQINNWNERRKIATLEIKLLSEISANMERDSIDLNYIIEMNKGILELSKNLKTHIHEKRAYTDSLSKTFSQITLIGQFKGNYEGYESLKSAGINIVQNDSLRQLVVFYYQMSKHLEDVSKTYDLGYYFRQEVYPKYFKSFSWFQNAEPVDYNQLLNANDFHVALDYIINDLTFYEWQYVDMIELIKEVRGDIKKELDQRK